MTAIFPVVNRVIARTFAGCLLCACLIGLNGCGPKQETPPKVTAAPAAGADTAANNAPAEPEAPAAPVIGKVGDRLDKAGTAVSLLSSEQKSSLSEYDNAGEGKVYQVVEVVIEATGDEKISYSPDHFKLKDDTGVEYNSCILTVANDLKNGNMVKGEKSRGLVAFKVPKEAKGFQLTYDGNPFSNEDLKVRFAL